MKSTRGISTLFTFLLSLSATQSLAHSFGETPLSDVYYAASHWNQCASLPTDKLVAYMLSPTWWEIANANSDLTPSPMALSRWDNDPKFYPPGQDGETSPYRRAFWHPGVGTWQLDDAGLGSGLGIGKFETWDSAVVIAIEMSTRYCNNPSAYSVFGPWCACADSGSCGATDRNRCKETFNKIYDANGVPQHPIIPDPTTGRYGGSELHTCRFAEQLSTFRCIYVNPDRAEGYTGTVDSNPWGWISNPDGNPPLSLPFYVFREDSGGASYEWRYWMGLDTGFGFDYAARRLYGENSRTAGGLAWYDNVSNSPTALCDETLERGECRLYCSALSSSSGLSGRSTCVSGTPDVTTKAATGVSDDSATINLSANPNNSPTNVWFTWGSSSSDLSSSSARLDVGNGTAAIERSWTLSALRCDTTFYFRAWADGFGDPVPGDILHFTTATCPGRGGGETNPEELILNGDFSQDSTYWHISDYFQADRDHATYHNGPGYAYLAKLYPYDGLPGNNLHGTLYQQVTIPASSLSAHLSFWRYITTEEPSSNPPGDVMQLTVRNPAGDYLEGLYSYSNWSTTSGYVRDEFDLSAYIGQTIRIQFFGITNGTYPTVFRIDDVSLVADVPGGSRPDVTTLHPDQLTSSSARLNLRVNPNGDDTEVWFDLGANDSTPNTDTPHFSAGTGTGDVTLHYTVSDLDCDVLYYVRANARNSFGSDSDVIDSFLTDECPVPPGADSDPPENVTATSAVFTGDVDPNGIPTEGWFEWGDTQSLGILTPRQYVGADDGKVKIRYQATGLECDKRYYYNVFAENSYGQSDKSSPSSFKTDPCPSFAPIVQTHSAENITSSSATLIGQVNPNGLSTETWFEWGTNSALGTETPHQQIGSGSSTVPIAESLMGLDCDTIYYYRAAASNSDGTRFGDTNPFSTSACSSCGQPDITISDISFNSAAFYEACDSISVGPSVTVQGSGDLQLTAPQVSFGTGFSVLSGGKLQVGPSDGSPPVTSRTLTDDFEAGSLPDWRFDVFGSNQTTAAWGLTLDGTTVLELAGGTSSGGGDVAAVRTDFWQRDYAVSSLVKVQEVRNGGHHSGIVGRYSDSGNFYELSVNKFQEHLRLIVWNAGSEQDLGVADLPTALFDTWMELRLEVTGNQLRGYVNDTLYLEALDYSHTIGTAGLANSGSVAHFDDFQVRSLPVPLSSGIHFGDDFEDSSIDAAQWVIEGNSVKEENGVFKITTDVTDAGGAAESRDLLVDPTRPVVVERLTRLHYANDRYGGGLVFNWLGHEEQRFEINYSHYFYTGNGECVTDGFSISRNGSNAHKCLDQEQDSSVLIPGVWDQWFNEKIVYDPVSGDLNYYVDGDLQVTYNVGVLPSGADIFFLKFSDWGWYTGHEHFMDNIAVYQQ